MTRSSSLPTWIKVFFPLVHVLFIGFGIWHLASYNHTFSKSENWSTFDLAYNGTEVGSIGSSYSFTTIWFLGVSFLGIFGSTVLFGSTLMLFASKANSYVVFIAFFCTLISGFIIVLMFLSTSETIYPREDMTPPWRFSPEGFLRIDYSTSSNGRHNDNGHRLQIECHDGSIRSSDIYGRIFTAEPMPNPPTYTPRPFCVYYYSSPQGKLFKLCCALKENVVSSPYPRSEGEDIFRGLLIGYFVFLFIWFLSLITYIRCKKTLRVSSYEVDGPSVIKVRERAETI